MSEALFSTLELGPTPKAGYRLQHLEMLNWGTFDQRIWSMTLGGNTSLLTGDIGSGKSTLVDALTTLLMPANRISYNKAAGADAKERTLRSYVEGHYKSERVETSGHTRAIGLREGPKSYSVILGVFGNDGFDQTITLAQVFQQRERTGQPYRFFVTATKQLTVADDFADFGSDLRDLRRRLRAGGAEIFDDFPKYGTSLRRLLGIKSEQALELFHQTVSMKSVGNLNEFVRDHMLEASDSGQRVRDIIGHFEDLTKAHDAVTRAREQLEALDPIVATSQKYDRALADRAGLEKQRDAVRLYVAELRSRLLGEELDLYGTEEHRLRQEQDTARSGLETLQAERDALIEERAGAGGDRIGELERLAGQARAEAEARRVRRDGFDRAMAEAGLDPAADAAAFARTISGVTAERAVAVAARRDADVQFAALMGRARELQAASERIADEIASLEQRTSNLPVEQVDLRAQLCTDLGLTPEQLPYAGELLDVAEEHAGWRGAAERVLRGFAVSLLVPQEHYDAVAGWVNGRRLTFRDRDGRPVGARLVYERVAARRVRLQRQPGEGLLLAHCVEIKDGPFADYLADELVRRADFLCAESLEEFRTARRAVTLEGQVRSGERHEKDDRHRVDDPRRWVLGWANERKIAALRDEFGELQTALHAADRDIAAVGATRDELQRRLDALGRLSGYTVWSDLDVAEAESRAEEADAERARRLAGESRLADINQALERNEQRAAEVNAVVADLTGRLARITERIEQATTDKRLDDALVGSRPAAELGAARMAYPELDARLHDAMPSRSAQCSAAGQRLTEELYGRIERLTKELGGLGQSLAGYMNEVLRRWPELRSDMDATVESRGDFLTFHHRVADDDLPRFEEEFKRQLNTNTIRELAQFNNWLRRQAEEIDDRVGKINEALGAIPYNTGRYIKLEKQPTTNTDVSAFRTDLRSATDDTLSSDDDHYSEQRFSDVKRIIDRFRGREGYADSDKAWARRVTDVRNWFVFSASERDLVTDEEWEHYSDSDGKSGGQKEKLAYTILAASLAYQFGLEWGVEKSKDFRFAVIDEAFGRGSDVSTRYALELFAKLGLQLLIVTPLQKVHVIEPYVKAIGFVDNPTGSYSRLQTMTIEEYREQRDRYRS
ncbi:ATP-binding protein [Microlunatus sp. Gsoil 973]|uniref:ATP-binding protein n=1 Tax=Microlunatus sp. Gsoil 973 TaxID=2672569 RepID=UPI0012B4D5AB|nr:ATP-binding protein [Microlunatus sp. Gsoil 973]QGN34425.1 AAA family ATPase [Microlunatus sp. Gsoil 973]